jgi:hypothetical protein
MSDFCISPADAERIAANHGCAPWLSEDDNGLIHLVDQNGNRDGWNAIRRNRQGMLSLSDLLAALGY